MDMSRQSRGGFTLVELLVVITIIGMLVAMLVPAVGGIREQARLTQCRSRQHQLHLAASTYEAARGTFPSYFFTSSGGGENDSKTFSWVIALLPNMGERALHKKWVELGENRPAKLQFMFCPSNPPETTSTSPANYKGNMLVMRELRPYSAERVNNGDGAQHTILFSEDIKEDLEHNRWDVTDAGAIATQLCFSADEPDPNDPNSSNNNNNNNTTGDGSYMRDFLGSKHSAGIVVVMVAGNVRTISEDVDGMVYQALVTPYSGEHIDEDMLK